MTMRVNVGPLSLLLRYLLGESDEPFAFGIWERVDDQPPGFRWAFGTS
jgi:hypothetical protein